MPRNILYKLGLIVAVAAFSLFLSYPHRRSRST